VIDEPRRRLKRRELKAHIRVLEAQLNQERGANARVGHVLVRTPPGVYRVIVNGAEQGITILPAMTTIIHASLDKDGDELVLRRGIA
jgi:hypothetical protein